MEEKKVQAELFSHFAFFCALFLALACSPTVKTSLPPGITLTERGVLDVTAVFPGPGNYLGYDSTVLLPSKVCSDKSIFGAVGTAICEAESQGTTSTAAQVLAGTYFWDASGANVAGTMSNRGNWNLNSAFPGAGYFSGITSALSASDICNTQTFLGSVGTSVCQIGTATTPAATTDVLASKEYWDSTGTKRTGTITNQGGAWDLTTAFPGAGYYTGITSALTASDVCSSKNILGSAGTAVCNSVLNELLASNAIRLDNATIDLSISAQVDARARAFLSDEVAANATYTSNHLLVPNPKYDTDGQDDSAGIGATLRTYLVTVKGRPTKVCGLSGDTDTRISDCYSENGTKSIWEGKKYGLGGEADWRLVTLYKAAAAVGAACAGGSAAGCYEVWRDERTKLIWSDYVNNDGDGYNWFRAAGYSSSASTTSVTGKEGRAGVGTDCLDINSDPEVCQPATPISVCAPAASIANLNGVATYQNPDGTNGTYDENPAKGNISGASALWRLPTYADWAQAYIDGIVKVLPSMTGSLVFWTATSYSTNKNQAWIASLPGTLYPSSRDQVLGVRCVGH